ncbi:hypothetical protein CXF59_06395 [Flavobacterium sp. ALD4]|uniref:gliding motility-associated C-terminal domain-containing protein n=1 Tax=Flavobacterium sp. ALD4 TaxID=2058314 RepID=UPI000C3236C8|nr:gliding motility-associated C-terminal domain-containing protein [Flavobacterium sp. ALD4]PKH67544.1 hypothetical protein CXF59_06395 [Flavobacterium sp. ALD4]
MKHKLLLLLLFFSSFGTVVIAQKAGKIKSSSILNSGLPNTLKIGKIKAIIPPPLATAGSGCKEESANNITVVMAASGGSGDIIEWFADQTSSTILHSGSIYSPSIGKTTTYYVWSHSGADYSIRVPVVASVFVAPATVTLTVSPTESPICEGTSVTFTANGGADLFEFSVNGIVTQAMSVTKTYTTSTLKKGQTVSVRTRYGITLDGILTETAWGKGLAEDNVQSASLSPGAVNSYINGIKISPSEKELVFGLPGNLQNGGSILLFLDTKPSGFNLVNFGDVSSISSTVRGFNFFNDNPSTFDSYFEADYCLVIAKDDLGTSYLADVIELKTGNSIIGSPQPIISVKEGNLGINVYDHGFEVSVLKSLIGYSQGDIKFFAFTMQNDIVTNSFLSPELSSSSDYGSVAIDFNTKDPNPVVVSADALIPCYKEASILISLVEPPTAATVGPDQFNCILNSSSLGGNSPAIGTGVWTLKSGPGTASFSDANSGTSTATVDLEGIYAFTWSISNGVCPTSTADIIVEFNIPPLTPTASDLTECASLPIQTLTAIATSQTGETIVWYDAATGGNVVADPSLSALGTITYYAESAKDSTPCVSNSRTAVTLTINPNPIVPVSGGDQTACALSPVQTLTAAAAAEGGESVVWYDAATGGNVVTEPSLSTLGSITYYAESEDDVTSCVSASRTAVTLTLNTKPIVPVSDGDKTECALSPIQTLTAIATAQAGESVVWYDAATEGNVVPDPFLSELGIITYYAESVNNTTPCVSSARTAVTLTINPNPIVPVSGGDQAECALSPIQTLTATATVEVGESVVWYDANTDGNIIAEPSLNSLGSITYYAESVNDATSCASTSRLAISLTINPRPEVPVSGGDLTECTDGTTTQTLTATAEGNSISWYTTDTGGSAVSEPTQVGVGSTTYYAEASDGVCQSLTRTGVTLTIVGIVTNPTANDQTICSDGTTDQTITAIAVGDSITWYTDLIGGTLVSNPIQVGVGTATYYAESSIGNCLSDARTEVTVSITATPAIPTATVSSQPTCADSTGEITIVSQAGVEYSIGEAFQDNPVFANLQSGIYTVSVRFKNNTLCEIKGADQIINPIPAEIQFESMGDCISKEYIITASPLASSYVPNNVEYQWRDNLGNPIGTNSNTLNGSDIIASSSAEVTFPLNYTLTITSTATGCETTNNIFIESVFCNIQKGISPDGNGSNDYFDLRLLDVKKLQIFDRYGIKVYSQMNYTNQWKGQSDNGNELPSATYYYVMEFNNSVPKTGWIYLIREK